MINPPVKIVLLDDHDFRVAGFSALLSDQELGLGAEIIHVKPEELRDDATNSDENITTADACVFVVGGLSFQDPFVMEVVGRLRHLLADRPVILLADKIDERETHFAMSLGVNGVVPTEMPSDVAVAAIQFLLAGGRYFPYFSAVSSATTPPLPGAAGVMSAPSSKPCRADNGIEAANRTQVCGDDELLEVRFDGRKLHLTPRQRDVLISLEKGLTNKEIGRALDLSESTVKVHVRHLMQKFGVNNRTRIALLVSSARHSEPSLQP